MDIISEGDHISPGPDVVSGLVVLVLPASVVCSQAYLCGIKTLKSDIEEAPTPLLFSGIRGMFAIRGDLATIRKCSRIIPQSDTFLAPSGMVAVDWPFYPCIRDPIGCPLFGPCILI